MPEPFLEYKEFNKKIKKKKVIYELVNTTNYINKYIANINITNQSEDSIKININLNGETGWHKEGNIKNISIAPNETKNLNIEFETYIDFPSQIEVIKSIDGNDKIEKYAFNLLDD